jgi:hypothetical protein
LKDALHEPRSRDVVHDVVLRHHPFDTRQIYEVALIGQCPLEILGGPT